MSVTSAVLIWGHLLGVVAAIAAIQALVVLVLTSEKPFLEVFAPGLFARWMVPAVVVVFLVDARSGGAPRGGEVAVAGMVALPWYFDLVLAWAVWRHGLLTRRALYAIFAWIGVALLVVGVFVGRELGPVVR